LILHHRKESPELSKSVRICNPGWDVLKIRWILYTLPW